ncbi:hypothetical protein [Streptomyces sp. MK7]|uniref:hypothetical protein n=1 Tax=Streptomyces sp. MK7 TaxID=3067635 RepID=UPI002931CED4|nr:hypothetical protein [Streptomyces sp. MK7]
MALLSVTVSDCRSTSRAAAANSMAPTGVSSRDIRSSEAAGHEPGHRPADHRLGAGGAMFVVACRAAASIRTDAPVDEMADRFRHRPVTGRIRLLTPALQPAGAAGSDRPRPLRVRHEQLNRASAEPS